MIWRTLSFLHNNLQSRFARWFRTREIVRVLEVSHTRELAETPGEQWAIVKSKHTSEIRAVRDGKFDIVDRKSWAYPYLPEALHRLNQPILKNTPYNLRRFSETPIPRRAINLIKNAVLALRWQIEEVSEAANTGKEKERQGRIDIATACFKRPNNVDSYRTFGEAVLEDIIIGGYGCIEPRMTPFYKRPFKMWAVDGSTIRVYADWTESTPDRPRFAQMTGLKGERGVVAFLADELIYIKNNNRSNTPFGLGMLEVAFNTVNAFLGVQDMAAKAGSDQVHKTWLWWKQPQNPAHIQTVRRHIQNELEGQQKISLMSGMITPEVLDIKAVNPEDLLLDWQEFLIRIIANAFDISALSLGLEQDVNRNTGEVLTTADFRSAVVPMARRVEEAFTRDVLQGFLGWKDLQFGYKGLDDPDALTKVKIQQTKYMMNSLTPDEIREDEGKSPLPGDWGKLTMSQMQLISAEAVAKIGGKMPGGSGAGMGSGGSGMGGGMTGPAVSGGGGWGSGGIGAQGWSPSDIAQMSPEDIQYLQTTGQMPPTGELGQQMDQQQPGILDQLSDELREFFEREEELKEKLQKKKKPGKVTKADERLQVRKFQDSLRKPTVLEQTYLDRYHWWKPAAQGQPGAKGKYPRSGGIKGLYK